MPNLAKPAKLYTCQGALSSDGTACTCNWDARLLDSRSSQKRSNQTQETCAISYLSKKRTHKTITLHCSLAHKEQCKSLEEWSSQSPLDNIWVTFLSPPFLRQSSWFHRQFSQLIAKEPPAPLALLVIERHVCLIPAPRKREAIKHERHARHSALQFLVRKKCWIIAACCRPIENVLARVIWSRFNLY